MSISDKDELLIGKIKVAAKDTPTKQLFDAFKPESSFQINVDLLGKAAAIKLPALRSAVEVLATLTDEYPALAAKISSSKSSTKLLLAGDIVKFIFDARELACLKCSMRYSPHSSDNSESEVSCFMCNRPGHKGCYSDAPIDPETGVVFVCTCCLADNNATKHPLTPTAPPAEQTQPPASQGSSGSSQPQPTEVKTPTVYDRDNPVCPLLKKGECPHGITGASNGSCENYHPPWCRRFMQNGPSGQRGCKLKDKCRYYHPVLCKNALTMNKCLNESCKLTHIRGCLRINTTRDTQLKSKESKTNPRKPSSNSVSDSRSRSPNRKQGHPPGADKKRVRYDSTCSTQSNNPEPLKKEDFLKHLAQMKADLTSEVTKDLTNLIQTSFREMMNFHQRPSFQTASGPGQAYLQPPQLRTMQFLPGYPPQNQTQFAPQLSQRV
jgi:hypothetical protein